MRWDKEIRINCQTFKKTANDYYKDDKENDIDYADVKKVINDFQKLEKSKTMTKMIDLFRENKKINNNLKN